MLNVTKLWVRSFDLEHLDVFWEIGTMRGPVNDSTQHEVFDYSFYILRSEAAMGPFEQVGGPYQDTYFFRDIRVSMLHKWRQYFYKIRVVHRQTGESMEFGPTANIEAAPDLIAAAIIREEDTLFREFIGRKAWLFPARTFGPHCACYDTTMGRVTRSAHLPCFGTGWLGGYLTPIEIYIQFDPSAKQSIATRLGETQPSNASARMSSFPPVSPRDIIIESENRRWRVVNVQQTQRLRAVVHQELQLHEVPRSDVEYAIPLNIDAQSVQPASNRNFKNSQNPESDADNSDILSFWRPPSGVLR